MIGSIWCIGKNFEKHAKELSESPEKEPIVFLKSSRCLVESGQAIELPSFSSNVQYEVEIACLFDKNLSLTHFTVALDLTARDVQAKAKEKGLPWTLSKSFKQSCPIGSWLPITQLSNEDFSLHVNGLLRQKGYMKDMLFSIDKLKEYLTEHFPVTEGDILLTGTPEGISTIVSGDKADIYYGNLHLGSWTFV